MPGQSFITSRKGTLSDISIYNYKFEDVLPKEQKSKLCTWLSKNADLELLEIKQEGFSTLKPLLNSATKQYYFITTQTLSTPFQNTSYISTVLSKLINAQYCKEYSQYLNKNIFVISTLVLSPFKVHKCFEYNIELFEDGNFFIHFFPTSKIVSESIVNDEYLKLLKDSYQPIVNEEMFFTVADERSNRRTKINLLSPEFLEEGKKLNTNNRKLIATFDYHFVANFNKEIFGKITEHTERLLIQALDNLKPISMKLLVQGFINWHKKPFYEVNMVPLLLRNNLVVGEDKKVNQQKAAFYHGMYRQVDEFVIQPIVIDKLNISEFKTLVNLHFNKNGTAEIYEPIFFSSNTEIDPTPITDLLKRFRKNIIFPIFTMYQLPKDYLNSILKLGLKHQIYCGKIELYQLSNFVVKCLEKAGGLLTIVDNLYEPETTYFIGLDMGHTTHNNEDFTNLCLVLFDNKGCFLNHWVINKIPKNEALNPEALKLCFSQMAAFILRLKYPQPKKIIVHRDGKIHYGDVDALLSQAANHFNAIEMDVVEVIKSGYPVIGNLQNGSFTNPNSGEYWIYQDHKYAILVTNVQADKKGEMLNPIVVKQKYGSTPFSNLVEQLYWFTKIYTNNLYNSTRLPATTEKANNLVGTSNKVHTSSYLA